MTSSNKRPFNFSPGPAALPEEVLTQIQSEFLDWQGRGVSIVELGHRTQDFMELTQSIENNVRQLLNISEDYHVLFLSGGARIQFAMIPLNLLGNKKQVDFVDTGFWSQCASQEASKYCDTNIIFSASDNDYTEVPRHLRNNKHSAYVHYTANETINGLEFHDIPVVVENIPLVSDMTSNLFAYPLDVSRFGLVYSSSQKNLGIAGLCLVIVRKDLVQHASPLVPQAFHYRLQAEQHSLVTTPPAFTWYVLGLMLDWLKRQGGLLALEKINRRKADKLYTAIDDSELYQNMINASSRSRMNVVFNLADKKLEEKFLFEADANQLKYLKGHKVAGGIRASIYNGVSEKAVDTLVDFMRDFERRA